MAEAETVEAILFTSGKPLRVKEMVELTGLEERIVRKALRKLSRSYNSRNTALEIAKIGPKYCLQLKEEFAAETRDFAKTELSHEVLKTAAIIAYYQPMYRHDLVEKVGEAARGHVDELLSKKLIYQNRTNRGFRLETSPKFFEFFGLEMTKKEELKQFLAEKAGL